MARTITYLAFGALAASLAFGFVVTTRAAEPSVLAVAFEPPVDLVPGLLRR